MFCKTFRWQTHTLTRETGRLMQILTFASCTTPSPSSSLISSSAANCLWQLTSSSLPSYPADHLEPLTQPSLLSHICLPSPPAPESAPWKPTGLSGQGSSQANCRPLSSPPLLQIQSLCLIPQQTAYHSLSFLSAPTTGRSYKSSPRNLLHSTRCLSQHLAPKDSSWVLTGSSKAHCRSSCFPFFLASPSS